MVAPGGAVEAMAPADVPRGAQARLDPLPAPVGKHVEVDARLDAQPPPEPDLGFEVGVDLGEVFLGLLKLLELAAESVGERRGPPRRTKAHLGRTQEVRRVQGGVEALDLRAALGRLLRPHLVRHRRDAPDDLDEERPSIREKHVAPPRHAVFPRNERAVWRGHVQAVGLPVEAFARAGEVAPVTGVEGRERDAVVGREEGVELAEAVAETVRQALAEEVWEDLRDERLPHRDDGRDAISDERPFEAGRAQERRQGQLAGQVLLVAVARPHVDHRRDAAAVARAEAARVEIGLVEHLLREGAVEAEDVERQVDGQPVEERQVLIDGAAADEEEPAAVALCDDAGDGLEVARQVARDARHRHAVDLGGDDLLEARRHGRHAGLSLGAHHDLVERFLARHERDLPLHKVAGRKRERIGEGCIADERDREHVAPRRQAAQQKGAVAVGGRAARAGAGRLDDDRGALQRLLAGRIDDEAAHRGRLRRRREGDEEGEQGEDERGKNTQGSGPHEAGTDGGE